jgi:hypothetical protein
MASMRARAACRPLPARPSLMVTSRCRSTRVSPWRKRCWFMYQKISTSVSLTGADCCRDPFQHGLDHQVARHRLAQRRPIQADAFEIGVILVIVGVATAYFHQAGVDRGRREHHAGRFRCFQDQRLDLLLPGRDTGHPVQFFRGESLQRLAEQLRGELDRAVDAARPQASSGRRHSPSAASGTHRGMPAKQSKCV